LPRFKNYSDEYRKILLIANPSFSSSARDLLKQNNIEIFAFPGQITHENFQNILNELLPLITKDILDLDLYLPDVSYISFI